MSKQILKYQIGKTPMIRAKGLEKFLGIEKIYLKLEGNNPSNHREDRLAYLLIKDAISRGKKTLCMGTTGTVGASLAVLSGLYDLNCVFYINSKEKLSRKKLFNSSSVKLIEHGKMYRDSIIKSREVSKEKDWYDANPGLSNSAINLLAFSPIASEIFHKIKEPVSSLFCQTSNGFSISGLHLKMKELLIQENIKSIPKIFIATTAHGNPIAESYKCREEKIMTLRSKDLKISKYNRNLVNTICTDGQDALNAVYDTDGKVIDITDEELVNIYNEVKKIDKIKFSIAESYSLIAFVKEARAGNIKNGNHVIIMNDGKLNLNITEFSYDNIPVSVDEFTEKMKNWLGEYGDPYDEIKEAVVNALHSGFVLGALYEDNIVGAAVIINMGFEKFATNYHLAYIASQSKQKGKGIATQLLEQAIDLTGGNLSLHVEFENKGAIKLYEKMGFARSYLRMLHKSKEH